MAIFFLHFYTASTILKLLKVRHILILFLKEGFVLNDIKIFACNSAEPLTKEIADYLFLPISEKESFKFANDNNFVQFKESIRGQSIYIVQTTEVPVNERIMELLITIDAAKRASPEKITVILPYFMYSRSDKKDQPRVPITAKLMAKLIETAGADRVITCDLHNAAIQAYFEIGCDQLTATYLIANFFKKKNLEDIVVVATDAGSSKRAYKYSRLLNCPIALIDKRRAGNDDKAVAANIIGEVKGKTALIFDDEISTGGTLIEAINICHLQGAKEVYAGATHGVFAGKAIERLQSSPVKEVVVTNTVPLAPEKQTDKIKVLSVAPLFAEAIMKIEEHRSLGDLFLYEK